MSSLPLRLLALVQLLWCHSLFAAIRTWDGSSGTNWNTAANWSAGVAPVAGDALAFPAGAANRTNHNNLTALTRLGAITIADTYLFSGGPLLLTNGITLSSGISSVNRATFQNSITAFNNQTFSAGASFFSSRLVLAGPMNVNQHILTVDGSGTTEFSGDVSSHGTIVHVGSGTLLFPGPGSFAGDVETRSGATIVNGALTNATFVGGAGTLSGTGRVANLAFGGQLLPGASGVGLLTVESNAVLATTVPPTTVPATFVARLSGTNAGLTHNQLRVNGAVSLPGTTFGFPRLRTELGYTPQMGDSFRIIDNRGTQAVVGSFNDDKPPSIPIPEGGFASATGHTFQVTYSGGDGNDVVLTKVPVSIWKMTAAKLTHTNRNWTAGTNWHSETVPQARDHLIFRKEFYSDEVALVNDFPPLTTFSSITFDSQRLRLYGNPIVVTGGITNAGPAVDENDNTLHLPIVITSNIVLHTEDSWAGSPSDMDFHGPISGTGDVYITGPGRVALLASNAFAGDVYVQSAGIHAEAHSIPGSLTLGGGPQQTSVHLNEQTMRPTAALTILSSGKADIVNSSVIQVNSLILAGGTFTASYGVLRPGNIVASNAASPSTIDGNGHLDLGGGHLSVTVGDGPLSSDLVILATLTNGTLRKLGPGTLQLSGTNVHAGTLIEAGSVVHTGYSPFTPFTLNGGVLSGNGWINALVANGGTVTPGDGVGRLPIFGSLHLNAASTLFLELNGTSAGTTHDQLSVSGTVNIVSAALTGSIGFNSQVGQSFMIITNGGANTVQGTFAGLAEGARFVLDTRWFTITYAGGDGNDVVITRVSGPASITGPMRLPNGTFQFGGQGEPSLTYTIQANTNVHTTNWINIATTPANSAGLFQFLDAAAPQYPMRFYRALAP